MIRQPAVAGQFYPSHPAEAQAELERLVPPAGQRRPAIAVVVPHAGWMYSGKTAGRVYSTVRIPDRVILVGPNHRGAGSRYAVFSSGAWRTPVGDAPIAAPLASLLLDSCESLTEDTRAHGAEHSLEVQVPMLLRANPDVQIVPLLIGGGWPEAGGRRELRELAAAIANAARDYGRPVLLLASTDLNHYEDQQTSNIKDKLVLDAIVRLDEEVLMDRVRDLGVSMCGVAPTYVVLHAAKRLGAQHAELLEYCTSGDATGDYSAVVGYAGIVIV
jgi:AmmeMemoRadiSam system protein B